MIVKIRVVPNSSKNVVVAREDLLRVKVMAPPEDGKANRAVIKLLAKYFGVKKSQIAIISGERSRNKTISVEV